MVVLVGGLLVFRLYRSWRRTARNLEEISSVIVDKVTRPLSSIPALVEAIKQVVELIGRFRSKERRGEDGGPQ